MAITDPDSLERLEKKGFALDALFKPGWQRGLSVTPANNAALSAIPQMQDVFRVVEHRSRRPPADSTSGACLPPYFMMQFRVDGHP